MQIIAVHGHGDFQMMLNFMTQLIQYIVIEVWILQLPINSYNYYLTQHLVM